MAHMLIIPPFVARSECIVVGPRATSAGEALMVFEVRGAMHSHLSGYLMYVVSHESSPCDSVLP